ncbi:ChaB family protein [Methylovirgula sp. 4M-Z18]|uniref:ChaB family protein n=1 Tax=Methylovirgula sp. 4M-Z18 TaxID=2293567 RepID=UPI000E2F88DE|nr:ChaB family protein [Methylovirgula sp. 4M-Z18]RFB76449.1 cation transporter [Methylovirgula sp. 4M-Z18]
MPYESVEQLPIAVRDHLPLHAAEIYRSAFNHAWASYANRGPAREEICHRVAWAAVKRRYRKADGVWVER